MKIYTRTGDNGTTSLFTGTRVHKNHPFIQALGAIDEGNSTIGTALAFLPRDEHFEKTRQQLEMIQHALFDLGAAVATPRTSGSEKKLERTRFSHAAITSLEQWMDEMDKQLPPLKTFILPGGHPAGAFLHVSRSIIRGAERLIIPLYEQSDVDQDVLTYLNRLSDYLFMTSRYVNHILKVPETCWQPHTHEKK
jgi:cob(I)alamin adenosyltransferase